MADSFEGLEAPRTSPQPPPLPRDQSYQLNHRRLHFSRHSGNIPSTVTRRPQPRPRQFFLLQRAFVVVLIFIGIYSPFTATIVGCAGTQPQESALFMGFVFLRPVMRLIHFGILAIAAVTAWLIVQVNPAAAQSFDDRWSIIPKAHAEPAPEPPNESKQNLQEQPSTAVEQTNRPSGRSPSRSFNRAFSGKASYYSYSKRKTASGSSFNRDALTAAHRSLPFGTRVRVTETTNYKSVVVRITDRGPWVRGRVLDLSLGAARSLGITDRGVSQVRAEVL